MARGYLGQSLRVAAKNFDVLKAAKLICKFEQVRESRSIFGNKMDGPELSDKLSEFLLAEYNALRAEILALEERATNIQIAGLTGIPTLLAAGDYWHLSFLIIFGPVIIVVAALMLIYTGQHHERCKYIKDWIEPHFLGGAGGWESFLQEKKREEHDKKTREDRRRVEKRARLSVIIEFAFYYLFSLRLAYPETLKYGRLLSVILMTTYIGGLVWAFAFICKNFPKGTD